MRSWIIRDYAAGATDGDDDFKYVGDEKLAEALIIKHWEENLMINMHWESKL